MLSKRNLALGSRPNLNPPISAEARKRIAEASSRTMLPRARRLVPYEAMAAAAKIRMHVVDNLPPNERAIIREHGLKRGYLIARDEPVISAYKRLARRKAFKEDFELAFRHHVIWWQRR